MASTPKSRRPEQGRWITPEGAAVDELLADAAPCANPVRESVMKLPFNVWLMAVAVPYVRGTQAGRRQHIRARWRTFERPRMIRS